MKPSRECLEPFLLRWANVVRDAAKDSALPEWAVDLLVAGLETPEVLALAVCDRHDDGDTLRAAAQKALRSLGVPVDAPFFAERVSGLALARQILAGAVAPREGLDRMMAIRPVDPTCDLFWDWVFLYDMAFMPVEELTGGSSSYAEAKIESDVREIARKFLDEHDWQPIQPDH